MANDIGYERQLHENACLRELQSFLQTREFGMPSKQPYTNIVDQRIPAPYCIPEPGYKHPNHIDENTDDALAEFFALLEKCRRNRVALHFSEKQRWERLLAEQESEASPPSCLDMDFDIYLVEERSISPEVYETLIQELVGEIARITDWSQSPDIVSESTDFDKITFHCALMCKPQRKITKTSAAYREFKTECWKESFHIRVFLRISPSMKRYIYKKFVENTTVQRVLNSLNMHNDIKNAVDQASLTNVTMFYGSMKRDATCTHELRMLYRVEYISSFDRTRLYPDRAFDESYEPQGRNKKRMVLNYNLVRELSLCYDDEYIKKPQIVVHASLRSEIAAYGERTSAAATQIITDEELSEADYSATDLCVRDFHAKYVRKLLNMLSRERAENYETWKSIITILARENPAYYPLAVEFSMRCPESFVKNSEEHIRGLFEAARNHSDEIKPRTIGTLIYWARQDSPQDYEEAVDENVRNILARQVFRRMGNLVDSDFSLVLKQMWGQKYRCAHSRVKNRIIWREFLYPGDSVIPGSAYKWRETTTNSRLYLFIQQKLPDYMQKVLSMCNNKTDEDLAEIDPDEAEINKKRVMKTNKRLRDVIDNLGKYAFTNSILRNSNHYFMHGHENFEIEMDKNPDVIGVCNGVLRLRPRTELIQRYHEIPISRSTAVDYIAYDKENKYVQAVERVIYEIFGEDEEIMTTNMILLAMCLDGHPKNPQRLVQWVGSGSQGKTVITEFMINTLGESIGDNMGYAAKLNMGWLSSSRASSQNHDTNAASLDGSRYIAGSEGGEVNLAMDKIKEVLSEKFSTSDKNEKVKLMQITSHIFTTSNYEMKIEQGASDYGAWRRMLIHYLKYSFMTPDKFDPTDPTHRIANTDIQNKWVHDKNYLMAFFSILVHYYEIYRDRYNSKFENVPQEKMQRETLEYQKRQDVITRFLSNCVVHVGTHYADGEPVRGIPLAGVANSYINWYSYEVNTGERHDKSKIISSIREHRLIKRYIKNNARSADLLEHVVLEPTQSHDDIKNKIPKQATNARFADCDLSELEF